MNARQLIEGIEALIAKLPEAADYPVHMLDMTPDDETTDGGIVTEVEVDLFDGEQGWVLSLISDTRPPG